MNFSKLFFKKIGISVFLLSVSNGTYTMQFSNSEQEHLLRTIDTRDCIAHFDEGNQSRFYYTLLHCPLKQIPLIEVSLFKEQSLSKKNSSCFKKSVLNALQVLYGSLEENRIDMRPLEIAWAWTKNNNQIIKKIKLNQYKDNSSWSTTLRFGNQALAIKVPEITSKEGRRERPQLQIMSNLDLSDSNDKYTEYKKRIIEFIRNVVGGPAINICCNGSLSLDGFDRAFNTLSEQDIEEIIRKSQEKNCQESEQQNEQIKSTQDIQTKEPQNSQTGTRINPASQKQKNLQKFSLMSTFRKYKSYFFGGSVLSAAALGLGYLYYNNLWFFKR